MSTIRLWKRMWFNLLYISLFTFPLSDSEDTKQLTICEQKSSHK